MACESAATRDVAWDWMMIRARCAREAQRIVRDPHDAEEVVQEAMARAFRRQGSCRTPSARLAWCLQITRNEAFRFLSRRRARAEAEAAISAEVDVVTGDRSEELIDRVGLQAALADLTLDDRRLIGLRYSVDLSQPDVAKALRVPEGTVKVRLHRVRNRLRAALTDT